MDAEETLLEDVLTSLCCGDRCKAGTDHEGGCERWAYKQEADALMAEAKNEASALLANISKRQAQSR